MTDQSSTIAAEGPSSQWKDPKRLLWSIPVFLGLIPLAGWWLHATYGYAIALWLAPIIFYVFVPIIEIMVGTDTSNPPNEAIGDLRDDSYYPWAIYAGLPFVYIVWLAGAWYYVNGDLAVIDQVAVILAVGLAITGALNAGHETGHRRDKVSGIMARLMLGISFMGHFRIEHNLGHHVQVATREDSATAMMGENFYAFVWRELPGGYIRAWKIEAARLKRQGKSIWSPSNELLQNWGMSFLFYAAITAWLGWIVLPCLLGAALIANLQLSSANYIEHYGLVREKNPDGKYERVQPYHSWNANHIVSNVLLYHLQRHSDHHAHAERPYQCLRHFHNSPQLPHGYFTMYMLAWNPPLWFKVMDPILAQELGNDMTKAYIKPGHEDRMFERYHKAEDSAAAAE